MLRQDHILIGRKELPRFVAGGPQSTGTTVVLSRPSLDLSTVSASTVSSTSSSGHDSAPHSHHSTARSVPTSRSPASTRLNAINDTEAIIEVLFNPPMFSSATNASVAPSNQTQSSQSAASACSVTTTTEHSILNALASPHEYPGSSSRAGAGAGAGAADVGEFGALGRGSTDDSGTGTGVGTETNVTRRPSVATTATSTTASSGWGGDDDQNQSHRGRLLDRLKKPFIVSGVRRAMTPTPGGSGGGRGLSASSTSIGGKQRSSLDIVYPAPVPALGETKPPTLTGDSGVTPAQQTQRQMYQPSPKVTTRTLLAVPVSAR
jgi:hypothetical protein